MQISFVIPSRNNLVYFRWAYNSIRTHQGNHEVFICAADDASTDGTREYFEQLSRDDDRFSFIVNDGPNRVGHTILYDRIINELVKTEVAIIFHADMYLCPNALDEIEKLMFTHGNVPVEYISFENGGGYVSYGVSMTPNYKTIVSLTRIEPPLHPDGPEKYLADWGVEPEQFNETAFLQWFSSPEANGYKPKHNPPYTTGVFAPWAFFVKDFKEIGGHDPLYRPQSIEDSDIFNRFKLNGVKFIQTWLGCVYHMTCRGSRFNPTLTTVGINSLEWETHNLNSKRNFIRKWGTVPMHDALMDPIIPPKYKTAIVCSNLSLQMLYNIEIWGDIICSLKNDQELFKLYIEKNQSLTDYDLSEKLVCSIDESAYDVVIYLDCSRINNTDIQYLSLMSQMVANIDTFPAEYGIGNLKVKVNSKQSRESKLVHL